MKVKVFMCMRVCERACMRACVCVRVCVCVCLCVCSHLCDNENYCIVNSSVVFVMSIDFVHLFVHMGV